MGNIFLKQGQTQPEKPRGSPSMSKDILETMNLPQKNREENKEVYFEKLVRLSKNQQTTNKLLGLTFKLTADPSMKSFKCEFTILPAQSQDYAISSFISRDMDQENLHVFFKLLTAIYVSKYQEVPQHNDFNFEDYICCICMNNKVSFYSLCGHSFCSICINQWFQSCKAKTCPTCKKSMVITGNEDHLDGYKIISDVYDEINDYETLIDQFYGFLKQLKHDK